MMKNAGIVFRLRLALQRRVERLLRPANYHRPIPVALDVFQRAHPVSPESVRRSLERGIAVVVPVFNHEAYLEDMLTSLSSQTYRPFQAVFVEDHSTDGSYEHLRQLCGQLPAGIEVKIGRTPANSGQAAAINQGVAGCTADVITILNDDDILKHDALEAGLEILFAHPQVFLLGAAAVPFYGADFLPRLPPGDLLIRTHHPNFPEIPLRYFGPHSVPELKGSNDINMAHSGMFFLKSAWEAAGGYYPDRRMRVDIHADRDFQLRVASLLPVAVTEADFAFWRSDSSVDRGVYS